MTHLRTAKRQTGVGLIEVLIAAVVIAMGLLAVASLQGKLMLSSGQTKTRAEAQALAEQKIEQLRNNVKESEYNALAAGIASDYDSTTPYPGTNANFTRSWTISGGDAPAMKTVTVIVRWDSNGDGSYTDADEHVSLYSEFAWINPGKSSLYAASGSAGVGAAPSPRQNASEDVASESVDDTRETPLPGEVTISPGTLPETISVTGDGGASYTLQRITDAAPATHFYVSTTSFDDGVLAIYQCDDDGDCKYIQNHFGGVALRIAGTVYSTSGNGLSHITVAWTSSEVHACYNGPITPSTPSRGSGLYSMPYECVFAGNCNATADGVNHCAADSQVSDDEIDARRVGPGGEYGDVGLLGVIDSTGAGLRREQICFLEDTVDPATSPLLAVATGSEVMNNDYRNAVTKRFYSTRQVSNNGSQNSEKSQGINRTFVNHNFLIVERGTGATRNQICYLNAIGNSIELAPSEIFQIINESSENIVLSETGFSNTTPNLAAKTLTGDVTGSATKLNLYIPRRGACHLNNNESDSAATAYACAVAADAPILATDAGVYIYGTSQEHPTDDPGEYAFCNKKISTTCDWLEHFASGAATDSCTTPWGGTLANGSTINAYSSPIVPFGGDCSTVEGSLTCTDGALSNTVGGITLPGAGLYFYESCTPAAEANCTLGGTPITDGSSITAYQFEVVPAGSTCTSETRTCSGGILSGSYSFTSCSVSTTRNIEVTIVPQGSGTLSDITISGTDATCTGTTCVVATDWTGTLTATATCSGGGTVTGSSASIAAIDTAASITMGTCAGPTCSLPVGFDPASIASDAHVTAYLNATEAHPGPCRSEERYCIDGTLSGTYVYPSCSLTCTVPTILGDSTASADDISAVNSKIIAAGFTPIGTDSETTGTKTVHSQSPAADTTPAPACGSTVSYVYRPG